MRRQHASACPPLAQDRLALLDDGLVRITLNRAFNDGTFPIDLDPLSLLSRRHAAEACLAASVPAPGFTAPSGAPASNAGRGPSRTPSTSWILSTRAQHGALRRGARPGVPLAPVGDPDPVRFRRRRRQRRRRRIWRRQTFHAPLRPEFATGIAPASHGEQRLRTGRVGSGAA